MDNLRKLIREHIRLIFNEMKPNDHFRERESLRLRGYHPKFRGNFTDFPGNLESLEKDVEDMIEFLELKVKIEFPEKLGIYKVLPKEFKSFDPLEKKWSVGNYLWTVSYGNELSTIMFSKAGKVPTNTEIIIEFDKLVKYFKEQGSEHKYTLNQEDFNKIIDLGYGNRVKAGNVIKKVEAKPEKPKDLVFKINGVSYSLDTKTNQLYQKNKPEKKYNIFDVLDNKVPEIKLDDKTEEQIMDLVI